MTECYTAYLGVIFVMEKSEAPPVATDVIGSNLEATDFVVGLSIYQRNSCIMVNFLMNVFASIYGKDVWKMCQIRILSFYPC